MNALNKRLFSKSKVILVSIIVMLSFLGVGMGEAFAFPGDHYLSYKMKMKGKKPVKLDVLLADQFSLFQDIPYRVTTPKTLLVPTEKVHNETFPRQSESHLISYVVSTDFPPSEEDIPIEIQNQFTPIDGMTGENMFIPITVSPRADRLLVPANKTKVDGSNTSTSGMGVPSDINHYLCYPVFYEFEELDVLVTNQFTLDETGMAEEQRTQTIITPRHFCNPVVKTVEGEEPTTIVDDRNHLVCYIARPRTNKPDRHTVETIDQFAELKFETNKEKEFCVPTKKRLEGELGGLIVFVTSQRYTANLGGFMGAAIKCNTLALNATGGPLPGTGGYLPWLSAFVQSAGGTVSPDTTFNKSMDPYVLVDNTKVADSYTDLTDGSLDHAIDLDENGNPVSKIAVWTAVEGDGTPLFFFNCSEWTDTTNPGGGFIGSSDETDAKWTKFGLNACDNESRLYCFQQQ